VRYQGISFFSPFFFLLVDSELVSTGVGFTGVEALFADCAEGCPGVAAGAAPGAALAPVAPDVPEELVLELDEFETAAAGELVSAGAFAVPEPFRPASTVPLVAGGGATAGAGALVSAAAGAVAAGCSEVGWPLSSSGVRISAPTLVCAASEPAGTVVASSGVTTSVLVEVCALAPAALPVTVNDGPAAPGRSTSVAETASFGGAICGVPPRAAVEVSGLPLSMPSGSFTTALW